MRRVWPPDMHISISIYIYIEREKPPFFLHPTHPWSGVAVDMLPSLVVAAAGIKLVVGIGGGS